MLSAFDPALFWNVLFDKGLLALIILGAAHQANRYLERYRSEQALVTEAAKTRLAVIGSLWEEMNLWERDSGRLFIEFCGVALRELRAANIPGVPAEQGEAERAVQVVMSLPAVEIPENVVDRIAAECSPRAAGLAARASEFSRQIDRSRFWLGEDLYAAMQRHHLAMQQTALLLAPNPESMRKFKAAANELAKSREGVDHVLSRLLEHGRRKSTAV